MSFHLEFDDYRTKSAAIDGHFDDEEDDELIRMLAEDSTQRVHERMRGQEMGPTGERTEKQRVESDTEEGPDQVKVSSLDDLSQFVLVADGVFVRQSNEDDLVRESEKDLWTLNETPDGEMTIEKLYDDNGDPIKA